jgi:hypothetical protein
VIATTVAMHDVRDAEGFVAAAIQRSGIRLAPAEREELIAEGLAIMCDLANRFEAHRAGYQQQGRFSGYAAAYLPKRMQAAWYRLHPEHQVRRDDAGKRVREFGQPAMSLHHEDMPDLVATAMLAGQDHRGEFDVIDRALARMPGWERLGARRVVDLLDQGHGTDDIARKLGMGRRAVTALQAAVGSAIYHVQTTGAAS